MSIEIRDLSFRYDHSTEFVLDKINLQIGEGEVIALMGASGSGKSTLIKIISSFLRPTVGHVLINEKRVKPNRPHRQIAYVSQSSVKTLFPWLTVRDNVYYPNKLRSQLTKKRRDYCNQLLEILRISDKGESYPLRISGGEQKKVSLAVALSYKPRIILLDEPFSGIDFNLAEELWDVLHHDFQIRKPTVLLVTHSLDEAAVLADRTIFLNRSRTLSRPSVAPRSPGREKWPRHAVLASAEMAPYKTELINEFNNAIRS